MSSEQIVQDFINTTNSDRKMANRYLQKNNFDLQKALREFYGGTIPSLDNTGKPSTWYAGGSKSGVAVISGDTPEQTPMETPVPISINKSEGPKPIQPANTDYSIPGLPKTRIRFEFESFPILVLTVGLNTTVGELKQYIGQNRPFFADKSIKFTLKPSTI